MRFLYRCLAVRNAISSLFNLSQCSPGKLIKVFWRIPIIRSQISLLQVIVYLYITGVAESTYYLYMVVGVYLLCFEMFANNLDIFFFLIDKFIFLYIIELYLS